MGNPKERPLVSGLCVFLYRNCLDFAHGNITPKKYTPLLDSLLQLWRHALLDTTPTEDRVVTADSAEPHAEAHGEASESEQANGTERAPPSEIDSIATTTHPRSFP